MFSAPGYHAIRQLTKNQNAGFKSGDVLVLFGELFTRGYANGLVEEAERRGMKIIRATVGRREKDGTLRALAAEEVAAQPAPLINVPLEAGFDMEADEQGLSPIERLKEVKLSDWESFQFPTGSIEQSRSRGRARFTAAVKRFVQELKPHLPEGKNILFAHLMAGGVPRAKILMPLMNRSFKGTGDRFLASEKFWNSSLGQLCALNFHDVTAQTFEILLQETSSLREERQKQGLTVSYSAYGYHGTEVLVGAEMQWQSYTPYLQGWAKIDLENFSREWAKKGVSCCVYNCPEILTNSSSIFQGVEIPLYPLLHALKKEDSNSAQTQQIWAECRSLLKPETSLEEVLRLCDESLQHPERKSHQIFAKWPQHNSPVQLEVQLLGSERLTDSHRDTKHLMTPILSEVVFSSCGKVMVEDSFRPQAPVSWLNHDVVAQAYLRV